MQTVKQPISFDAFLINNKILKSAQLATLGTESQRAGKTPEELQSMLSGVHLLSEDEACHALADFYGYPYINLLYTTFDPAALKKVTPDFVRLHALIPFFIFGNELSVAFSSLNLNLIDSLQTLTDCKIIPHLATKTQIKEAIEVQYAPQETFQPSSRMEISARIEVAVDSKAIIDLSHGLIVNAIKARATDIHLQPEEQELSVRYRVDGVLHQEHKLSKEVIKPLVARLKILAGLDIGETRQPQDGHIQFAIASRTFDLRLSVVPTNHGEKVVLRILDKFGTNLNMNSMFFSESVSTRLMNVISAPNGVIFITGPTGSGKTTTCYTIINHLNTPAQNIVTIEDPIEYQLPNISQIQVNYRIGLNFPTILRSILRQDPNIILVGEIRDLETARIALEAALTGHLVISTLHTNTAVQAVVRLIEMGVEPSLVAPAITGVMGQRLVRKICQHCRKPYEPDSRELAFFDLEPGQRNVPLFKGTGCEYCGETGYFGRMGVHELVVVTDEIRELIMHKASMQEIEMAAEPAGYRTMRYDGLKKALLGLTTLDEVNRVTTLKDDFTAG